jgi:uncharacterized protein YybS (DUF2232 family)
MSNGLFGTLNQREARLILMTSGLTAAFMALCPLPGLVTFLGVIGFLLAAMIAYNQYNRIKRGVNPLDPN